MDNGGQHHGQILRQGGYLRPGGDVGAEFKLGCGVGPSIAEVYPLFIYGAVERAFMLCRGSIIYLRGGGERAAVCRGGGNGAGVHKSHAGKLPVGWAGALPVGEVAGGVADGESAVCRHIPRAEAGAAEAGFEQRTRLHQLLLHAGADKLHVHRQGGRIYGQGKLPRADAFAMQYGGGLGDIVVHTAGAAGYDALLHIYIPVFHLGAKVQLHLAAELLFSPLFALS